MKRLVTHLRVFFDKRSGKAERIEAIYSRLQRHTSTFRWKNVELSTVSNS